MDGEKERDRRRGSKTCRGMAFYVCYHLIRNQLGNENKHTHTQAHKYPQTQMNTPIPQRSGIATTSTDMSTHYRQWRHRQCHSILDTRHPFANKSSGKMMQGISRPSKNIHSCATNICTSLAVSPSCASSLLQPAEEFIQMCACVGVCSHTYTHKHN